MNNATQKIETLRAQYRNQLDLAKNRLGWDAATVKAKSAGLVSYYAEQRNYSNAEAYVAGTTEAVSVAIEDLDV